MTVGLQPNEYAILSVAVKFEDISQMMGLMIHGGVQQNELEK
jgi:hypothetical protein